MRKNYLTIFLKKFTSMHASIFSCVCQFQLFSLVHDGLFFDTLNIYLSDNKIKINGINILTKEFLES